MYIDKYLNLLNEKKENNSTIEYFYKISNILDVLKNETSIDKKDFSKKDPENKLYQELDLILGKEILNYLRDNKSYKIEEEEGKKKIYEIVLDNLEIITAAYISNLNQTIFYEEVKNELEIKYFDQRDNLTKIFTSPEEVISKKEICEILNDDCFEEEEEEKKYA